MSASRRSLPVGEQVRVGEGEGPVAGDGDTLGGGGSVRTGGAGGRGAKAAAMASRSQWAATSVAARAMKASRSPRFLGLDQSEMAGGVGEVRQARHRAQDREARGAMARRSIESCRGEHPVEDDAGNTDSGVVTGESCGERGQQTAPCARHRSRESLGKPRRAERGLRWRRDRRVRAIEEAHRAFDQQGARALRTVKMRSGGIAQGQGSCRGGRRRPREIAGRYSRGRTWPRGLAVRGRGRRGEGRG